MAFFIQVLTNAIPNAHPRVIEGQGHDVDIQVLAPVLTAFFQQENEGTIDPVRNSSILTGAFSA
jgi:hypothetical protein